MSKNDRTGSDGDSTPDSNPALNPAPGRLSNRETIPPPSSPPSSRSPGPLSLRSQGVLLSRSSRPSGPPPSVPPPSGHTPAPNSSPPSSLSSLTKAIVALEKMKAKLESVDRQKTEPIAIIGMACRFPGGADTPEAFFRLLERGVDAVTPVPASRWQLEAAEDAVAGAEQRAVRWGGFLSDAVDRFDARFFGISAREANHLDPQQRLLLEVAWEALEGAGQDTARLVGSASAAFVGISNSDYLDLCKAAGREAEDVYTATGNGHAFAAGRLSYVLGLQGPSMAVDTLCSSSLVAVHLACQSLRSCEATLALACGVNLMLSPDTTRLTATTQGLSPDGRCKTFDASANGFVRSEGCGVVVLKLLSQAQKDGDPILALIRGSAVNQDGRSTGLTAPNVLSQQAMLQQALLNARVAPEDIGYIETHGTGTPLGDPIEFEALRAVLGAPRPTGSRCVLGAAKTNVGHLEAAAGVAGLIKAVMVLREETIPKNLHFRALNPRISVDGTPFVIPTENVRWARGSSPRIAGVSSFGMSGTNAHVILEEAPVEKLEEAPAPAPAASSYLVPLSARSPEALQSLAASYAEMLARADGAPLRDIAYTASMRRMHHKHRLALTGRTREEMAAAALARSGAAGGAQGSTTASRRPKVVFVFSGQGSQWIGMGRRLLTEEPVFRTALEDCEEILRRYVSWSLMNELQAPEERSRLAETKVVQPVLFAIQVGLARLLKSWNIRPSAVIGHSVGEVAAAYVAGVLPLDDAARLVALRGRIMQKATGLGKMVWVALPAVEAAVAIAGYEGELAVAAINDPGSVVLSGATAALDDVIGTLSRRGVQCRPLKVNYAFHSPQMDPLALELEKALGRFAPRRAILPFYSTVTGAALENEVLDARYWGRNVREPVQFARAVASAFRDGHRLFLEVGPHPVLSTNLTECLASQEEEGHVAFTLRRDSDERTSMLAALGALYTHGFDVDWTKLYPSANRCVSLPSYPWQRERYWFEEPSGGPRDASRQAAPRVGAGDEGREGWFWEPRWRLAKRSTPPALSLQGEWLVLTGRGATGAALVSGLRARGATCVRATIGESLRQIEPGLWEIDPTDPEAYAALLRGAFDAGTPCRGVLHLFGVDTAPAEGATSRDLARSLALGCESVLLLSQAMVRADLLGAPALWLLTRGAIAAGGERAISVMQAPSWGLGRTLQMEHPELTCKLLDLAPQATDGEIGEVCAELIGADAEDQIALRPAGRMVARLTRTQLPSRATPAPQLHADASYLVTGGLGGLGLAVAEWMVQRGARTVLLIGRSAPSHAARSAIARMENAGAKVLVAAADVSQKSDVEVLFARLDATLPPLRGLVHAAGVLEDRTVLELSIESMRKAAAPKIWGAWNLHEATRGRALEFFVLYGSAASLLGSAGQGNYAAANAFLDELAHHRRASGLPGLAIDWGPFSEVGLAASQANRGSRLAEMGFRSITPAEGNDVLGALLGSSFAQVGVVPVDLQRLVTSMPRLATSPYFAELVSTVRRAEPTTPPARSAVLAAPASERRGLLERLVREQLARVLRLDPDEIEQTASFTSYGFDSLMGVELRNHLQAALGLKLSMADIVTHAQSDALVALLLTRFEPTLEAANGAPEATPAASATATRAGGWVVIPRPAPKARMRLFCFAYAGGAASMYSSWPGGLPSEIELCAIQLPGRHERLHEPLLQSVEEIVAALVPVLLPYLDRPFATFGHCLGAIVMFEVLRELAAKHGIQPAHVFTSGAPSPPQYLLSPSLTARSNADFAALLGFIGFGSAGLLNDEDAERHLMPAVKGDFDVAARYRYIAAEQLTAPITAFAGREDSFAPPDSMDAWRSQTSSWFSKIVFPGEHYFIVPELASLLRIIGEELLFRLASIEQRRGVAPQEGGSTPGWLGSPAPRSAPRARLFCFPGVGRGSSIYADWPSSLGEDVEVCTIDLPGRGARAHELPLGHVDEIVEHLMPALRAHLDRPFAFFGLDVGAIVMFEISRRLRREGGPLPGHLFVGAAMAPQIYYFAPMHHFPRARLIGGLQHLGVSVDESAPAEQALRAECASMASYVFANEAPLDIPITAFIGARDSFVPHGGVPAWREQTTASFALRACRGTHDLPSEDLPLRDFVRETLSTPLFR